MFQGLAFMTWNGGSLGVYQRYDSWHFGHLSSLDGTMHPQIWHAAKGGVHGEFHELAFWYVVSEPNRPNCSG